MLRVRPELLHHGPLRRQIMTDASNADWNNMRLPRLEDAEVTSESLGLKASSLISGSRIFADPMPCRLSLLARIMLRAGRTLLECCLPPIMRSHKSTEMQNNIGLRPIHALTRITADVGAGKTMLPFMDYECEGSAVGDALLSFRICSLGPQLLAWHASTEPL